MTSHHVGKAGQLAAMSELALRGYNVAIPEIDIGDDILVLNHDSGQLSRIQVKTANGQELDEDDGYRCLFRLKISHVHDATKQGSHYVFAGRCGRVWRFLIMERGVVSEYLKQGWGTASKEDHRLIWIEFYRRELPVKNKKPLRRLSARTSIDGETKNLTHLVNAWKAWPTL